MGLQLRQSQDFDFISNELYLIQVEIDYKSGTVYPIIIRINNQDVWMEINHQSANVRNIISVYHLTVIDGTQSIEIFEQLSGSQTSQINTVNIMDPAIIEYDLSPSNSNTNITSCDINAYSYLFVPHIISSPSFNILNTNNLYDMNTLARDDTKYGIAASFTLDFKLNLPLIEDNNDTIIYLTDSGYEDEFSKLYYDTKLHKFGMDINHQNMSIPSKTELNEIGSGLKHIVFTFNNQDKTLTFSIDNEFYGQLIFQDLQSSFFFHFHHIHSMFLSTSNMMKDLRYFPFIVNSDILSECPVKCEDLKSKELCIAKSCIWFRLSEQCLNAPIDCKLLLNKDECNGVIFSNNNSFDLSHLFGSNCYYKESSKSCEIGTKYNLERKMITNIEAILVRTDIDNMYNCQTLCESNTKCIHWQYNNNNNMECRLFSNGQYESKRDNNYIHGYPLSMTGSLISHKISSEIDNECESRSLVHVIMELNYLLLSLENIIKNGSDIFMNGLYPQIKFEFGTMNVLSYYGRGGENIYNNHDENKISIFYDNDIVDLGWHCSFNQVIIVSVIADDHFNGNKNIQLFKAKLDIQPIYISHPFNSWYPVTINDDDDNDLSINGKVAMFKPCPIDCSFDTEMTIYATHFETSHVWSFIHFEIMYFGQFISTQQHQSGTSFTEKIMFKQICKLQNDIQLNPKIYIYENYEPVGKQLWGVIDDIDLNHILLADSDDDEDNIYIVHCYIKHPIYNGGDYRLQLNMDNEAYIAYLKLKIRLSETNKNCLIPHYHSSQYVRGYGTKANFGVATLITLICTVLLACIATLCFDIKRNAHYKLMQTFINKDDAQNEHVVNDQDAKNDQDENDDNDEKQELVGDDEKDNANTDENESQSAPSMNDKDLE